MLLIAPRIFSRSAGRRFRLAKLRCDKRLEPLLNRDGLDGQKQFGRNNKEGRHVGLDFYDLLTEALITGR